MARAPELSGLLFRPAVRSRPNSGREVGPEDRAGRSGRERSAFGRICTNKFLNFTPEFFCVDPFDPGKQPVCCHNPVQAFLV